MNPWKAVLPVFFLAVWALAPWPLVRWCAALAGSFQLLGALWSLVVARSLKVSADDTVLRAFSGRRVEVRTRVENRSPLPSGLLAVFDSSGGLETWGQTRRHTHVRPFTLDRFSFTVRARERGEKPLGPLRVAGTDPTGLFPFTRQLPTRSLIVYPPLRDVTGFPPGGLPPGPRKWEPALVDDPSRFRTFRDFQPGDPLSRVSAAAWARFSFPQVRTYDRTVARPTGVVVDLGASRYPLRLRWALVEQAVETAASLVWDLLGQGEQVWLSVMDAGGTDRPFTLGPARGWSAARSFLERLALAAPEKTGAPWTGVLPPGPLRLLWVGPPPGPEAPPGRGYDTVWFPIEEDRPHGQVVHP